MVRNLYAAVTSRCHWRVFDDGHVVYDDRTGDTHLLTPLAADLAHRLESAEAGLDDLVDGVARARGCTADGALAAEVKLALDALVRARLVERHRS